MPRKPHGGYPSKMSQPHFPKRCRLLQQRDQLRHLSSIYKHKGAGQLYVLWEVSQEQSQQRS